MASNALATHLLTLLQDSEDLLDVSHQLPANSPNRPLHEAALNRAVIVTAVSAWEAYVEEVVREAVALLRPASPPLGPWPALQAAVLSQVGRFNTPSFENVRSLFSDAIGLNGVHLTWAWPNYTPVQARDRLAEVVKIRHQIAHGVHPRPHVAPYYARQILDYFRELGRCTDHSVRHHLVTILGIAFPWPP